MTMNIIYIERIFWINAKDHLYLSILVLEYYFLHYGRSERPMIR
jgi:hypothetical protein